jgi:hypothetical protein
VPNCNSFLVTEAERKHTRRRARFQQHRDASCHQDIFLQGAEGNSRQSERNIRASSYATIKNWVAQFKLGDFSTRDASRPRRTKIVTTPEIIDQIQELILENRRISAKSVAEQMGISRE